MDFSAVYSKTGKGARALASKSKALSANALRVLSYVDGKSDAESIFTQIGKLSQEKFNEAVLQLITDGHIKEIGADYLSESLSGFDIHASMEVAEISAEEFMRIEAAADGVDDEAKLKEQASAEARAKAYDEEQRRLKEEALRQEEAERQLLNLTDTLAKSGDKLDIGHSFSPPTIQPEIDAQARARAKARKLEAREKARREAEKNIQAETADKAEPVEKQRIDTEQHAKQEEEDRQRQAVKREAERVQAEREALARQEVEARKAQEEQRAEEARTRAKEEERQRQATKREAERVQAEREALAHQVAEARRAQEKQSAEEAKARAEQETRAKREAEEKARIEEKRLAEEARLKAEQEAREAAEAKARADAEEQARRAAEKQAQIEAEKQAKAERKAQEEARAQAEREAKLKQKAEQQAKEEIEAKIRAEAKARKKAEAEAQAAIDAAQRAREKAENERRKRFEQEKMAEAKRQEKIAADAAAQAKAREKALYKSTHPAPDYLSWVRHASSKAKKCAIGAAIVMLLLFVMLPFINLGFLANTAENIATASIGEPVHVESLHVSFWPQPHFILEGVAVGSAADIKAGSIQLMPELGSLSTETKVFNSIEIEGLSLNENNIQRPLAWLKNANKSNLVKIKQLVFDKTNLTWQGVLLPIAAGKIKLNESGAMQHALLKSESRNILIELAPTGSAYTLDITAHNWQLPTVAPVEFDGLKASGLLTNDRLQLDTIEGQLYGGSLDAQLILQWQNGWESSGKFNLAKINLAQATPAFTDDIALQGLLNASGTLSSQATELGHLLAQPDINARFDSTTGVIEGIDLVRALQARGSEKAISGTTEFDKFSGNLILSNQHYQYRTLELSANQLQAQGEVDIFADQTLAGKIDVKLALKSRALQSRIYLSGKLNQPSLK